MTAARTRPDPVPRASYRVQLRRHGVDFAAVARELPWLERLGISHVYLSPVLRARSGSEHGYDGIDPREVDPALGGATGLRALADACADRGMGLLVDLVPNHLAAHPDNPFFADLLARGPASPFADWFDVDWEAGGGRILLPWLTEPLRRAIARGTLRLEGRGRRMHLCCGALRLPLAAGTAPETTDVSPARLARIAARQCYALDDWRRARLRVNYRRFFDVNDLIGVRAEEPRVFETLHGAVLELVREGRIAGLRIDHVDGIADPARYLRRLRRELDAAAGRPALLVVEKILAHGEALPRAWPVDGATGYGFLNDTESLFLDPDGVARVERDWARRVRARGGFAAAARSGRRRVLRHLLSADLRRVARRLVRLPGARGADEAALTGALAAFLEHLDVYRVYPTARGTLSADERRRVERALRAAAGETHAAAAARAGLAALQRVLLPRTPPGRRGRRGTPEAHRTARERVAAARSVMQLAAAVAAKGEEDTALYAWTPLLSRNEVGGHPGRPLARALPEFHAANRRRGVARPRGLLAVSTHDTKRSADVRARLDVLSEIPDAWRDAWTRWRAWNAPLRRRRRRGAPLPDLRSELFLYQTLVGVWPLRRGGRVPSRDARRRLADRVEAYLVKAAREAKRESDWIRPDARFEEILTGFARALLLPRDDGSRFLRDLSHFVREVGRPGLWNALSRSVLQVAAPGIPDVYQGDLLWRHDLVDPDNRRPVDFATRARRLEEVATGFAAASGRERFLRALMRAPEDGRVKLHVLHRGLAARSEAPSLFTRGTYLPLAVRGRRSRHVVAFARRAAGRVALVAVPRLVRSLVADPEAAPVGDAVWEDTRVLLPAALAGGEAQCVLSGRRLRLERALPAARLFDPLPVALLLGEA